MKKMIKFAKRFTILCDAVTAGLSMCLAAISFYHAWQDPQPGSPLATAHVAQHRVSLQEHQEQS